MKFLDLTGITTLVTRLKKYFATKGDVADINDTLVTKQSILVSGENIKTINNESLLGNGNIALTASDVGALPDTYTSPQADWEEDDTTNESYILNKPAIRADEGKNSVNIGRYSTRTISNTLYITGAAGATTYSFTYQAAGISIPSIACLAYCESLDVYAMVKAIDSTNNTITFFKTLSSTSALTDIKVVTFSTTKAAIGTDSIVNGINTIAFGVCSHTEGTNTFAIGNMSHTEGSGTIALGISTHAEGRFTSASSNYQHVQGQYNIEDTTDTYAHIVGNGSSLARSNAHTLDWSGNSWYAGKVSAGTVASPANPTAANDLTTKQYVDTITASLGNDIYKVNLLGTATNALSVDKTFEEIKTAADSGKIVILYWVEGAAPSRLYYCTFAGNSYIRFDHYEETSNRLSITQVKINSDNSVTYYNGAINHTISLPSLAGTEGQILKANASGTGLVWADLSDNNTTYTLSMSGNVITITGSDSSTSSITLPIYDGSVSAGGGA